MQSINLNILSSKDVECIADLVISSRINDIVEEVTKRVVQNLPPSKAATYVPRTDLTKEHPVKELGLSARALNVLNDKSIKTIGELLATGSDSLIKTNNCGKVTLREIERALVRHGWELPRKKGETSPQKVEGLQALARDGWEPPRENESRQWEDKNKSDFITSNDIAARWGVSLETIKRRRREGVIKAYKLGPTIRFSLEEIEQLEANSTEQLAS